jgi:hypothetical protein
VALLAQSRSLDRRRSRSAQESAFQRLAAEARLAPGNDLAAKARAQVREAA